MFARVLKKTFHKEINETSSPLERKRKTISLFNNYFNENNKNSQPQLWFDSMKDFVSNGKITEQISKQLLSEKSELFKLISTSAIREKVKQKQFSNKNIISHKFHLRKKIELFSMFGIMCFEHFKSSGKCKS